MQLALSAELPDIHLELPVDRRPVLVVEWSLVLVDINSEYWYGAGAVPDKSDLNSASDGRGDADAVAATAAASAVGGIN